MRRQAAIFVAGSVAIGLGVAIVGLSTKLESEQSRRRQLVDDALAQQRRTANAADLEQTRDDPPPPRQTLCVRGIDTFASTAAQRNKDSLLGQRGRLDVDALTWLSRQATRAERRAEMSHAGPSLPQRMGRTQSTGTWAAIEPPTRRCRDTTAYASLALDTQRPIGAPGEK